MTKGNVKRHPVCRPSQNTGRRGLRIWPSQSFTKRFERKTEQLGQLEVVIDGGGGGIGIG